jgi:hypothetical protein
MYIFFINDLSLRMIQTKHCSHVADPNQEEIGLDSLANILTNITAVQQSKRESGHVNSSGAFISEPQQQSIAVDIKTTGSSISPPEKKQKSWLKSKTPSEKRQTKSLKWTLSLTDAHTEPAYPKGHMQHKYKQEHSEDKHPRSRI